MISNLGVLFTWQLSIEKYIRVLTQMFYDKFNPNDGDMITLKALKVLAVCVTVMS